MKPKIRIALIGCGKFCQAFVPLFKADPAVEYVGVCDLIRARAEDYARRFDVPVIERFEDALADPTINTVGIFTQRYSHGPLVIQALKAGKNVYSAVPCSISVDEIREIERLVRETRLLYSMGETGHYRAPAVFCRREFQKGSFGKFVYAEARYNHDIRNMEISFRSSGGEDWKQYAGIPPMYYPTHSTAMILSAMPGVYAKTVTALGYAGSPRTDIFGREGQNLYDNPFSNTTMLLQLSNGGIACVSENRCLGWVAPETYLSQFYGTEGCYEFSVGHHHQSHWDPDRPGKVTMQDVTGELQPPSIAALLRENYDAAIQNIADGAGFLEESPIQDTSIMPESYQGLHNGHNGTHKFLINAFCRAYEQDKLTPTNIWQVARYNIPGLLAHESAMQGGVTLEVPDLGEPPADWEVLEV